VKVTKWRITAARPTYLLFRRKCDKKTKLWKQNGRCLDDV